MTLSFPSCTTRLQAPPDAEMAAQLQELLRGAGLTVWLDPADREKRVFTRESGWYIPVAKTVLPLLSGSFSRSKLCLQELALAHTCDKWTVPGTRPPNPSDQVVGVSLPDLG